MYRNFLVKGLLILFFAISLLSFFPSVAFALPTPTPTPKPTATPTPKPTATPTPKPPAPTTKPPLPTVRPTIVLHPSVTPAPNPVQKVITVLQQAVVKVSSLFQNRQPVKKKKKRKVQLFKPKKLLQVLPTPKIIQRPRLLNTQ